MRFGGHETFPIREGWLHKGLKLLIEKPNLLVDEYAADWLGVGRNMAKSIRHWLVATGLAQQVSGSGSRKGARLQETELGRLIHERDPYFSEMGTWWVLHVNLINTPEHATLWVWFFNYFNFPRFERTVCVENLRRYLRVSSQYRMPSPKTIERDIACLLNSYAKKIPVESHDPEDALECPFIELGLLSYFRASGYYQLHQGVKDIPPPVFGYAVSQTFKDAQEGNGMIDIPLQEVAQAQGGPGRAFVLTSESLFEEILRIENRVRTDDIQIAGLAGDRVIRIRRKRPLNWLEAYYSDIEQRDLHAA